MTNYPNFPNDERRGVAAITILILLSLMFVALVFCVDIARVQLAELEVQCATDVATSAGTEAMSRGVGGNTDLDAFQANVIAEIQMIASLNTVANDPVVVDDADVVFGQAVPDPGAPGAFDFSASSASGSRPSGSLSTTSNAVSVTSGDENFPVIFGDFVGTNTIGIGGDASAMVQERDIVLVLDRTTSMFTRDAGPYRKDRYPRNLGIVEDLLFMPGDDYHDNPESHLNRSTEFLMNADGVHLELTRRQALKLAVYYFRKEIERSRGNEQLGLATYQLVGDTPNEAETAGQVSDGTAFDVTSPAFFSGSPANPTDMQNASEAFKRIVGSSISIPINYSGSPGDGVNPDGVTDISFAPYDAPHEKYASHLEPASSGYPNFDHTYLSMRYGHSTHIEKGLHAGVASLYTSRRRPQATPVLVLMTDGRQNSGSDGAAAATTIMANFPDTRIYTVGFGDTANIDEALLRSIALTGKGEYYYAANVDDLILAFQELARSAGTGLFQ